MAHGVTQNLGPFPLPELVKYAFTQHVKIPDLYSCACVSTLWNQCTENPDFWKGLFVSHGIPMVCNEAGARDYRSDLRVLYPMMTVSGEIFRQVFGEPIGEVPCILLNIFNEISQPDPFEPTKLQRETFEFVIEYPFIDRMLDEPTFLALNANYNSSEEVEPFVISQEPTRIPFTLRNRATLCNYSLTGQGHPKVFGTLNEAVLSQCDYCPTKVNIYYQRRKIPEGLGNLLFPHQKAAVEQIGLQVMPLGPRLLSDVVQGILLRTCPEGINCYARTSNEIYHNGSLLQVFHAHIGGPSQALRVHYTWGQFPNIGVAVGKPAEAL